MKIHLWLCSLLTLLLSVNIQAQIGSFRFAQLTDIHLSETNPKPTEDLLRSIAQINATDSLDFVLVTGDLTEEGDNATLLKVKQCLDLLRYPYYTVMGNHETKWSESGCTMFSKIFGGERFSFYHKGIQFLGFNTGPFMRMALGHVKPQDISWIQSTIKDKKQPVILVTHYPILEGDVDNWYEVTDVVKPYNIRLFIGGHYHRNKHFTYDGIPGVLIRTNLRDVDGLITNKRQINIQISLSIKRIKTSKENGAYKLEQPFTILLPLKVTDCLLETMQVSSLPIN